VIQKSMSLKYEPASVTTTQQGPALSDSLWAHPFGAPALFFALTLTDVKRRPGMSTWEWSVDPSEMRLLSQKSSSHLPPPRPNHSSAGSITCGALLGLVPETDTRGGLAPETHPSPRVLPTRHGFRDTDNRQHKQCPRFSSSWVEAELLPARYRFSSSLGGA